MYGAPQSPMTETSPYAPVTRKGELRVALSELRLGALRSGNARVCIGRASDFFGPELLYSHWNERFFQRLCTNRAGQWLGDPDTRHSYSFVDDVAAALMTLGNSDETGVWHLPTAPAETSRQVAARLGAALGVEGDVKRIPRGIAKALGLFSPFLREVNAMSYQWETPFILDDAKFVERFGQKATPLDGAVEVTARWARQKYQPAAFVRAQVRAS
jgi:nucleoside-diphosphate-sugar epimerase